MKKLTLSLACLLTLSLLSAQTIEEGVATMSQGNQNALFVYFSDAKEKDIETLWIKFARDLKGKTDKVSKTDEYMTDDASLPDISANTVDIYALARQEGAGVRMYLWFNLGGAYLSTRQHPDRIEAGRRLLRAFSQTVQLDKLETLVKEQESSMKKLKRDLSRAEKDVQKASEALREAERAEMSVRSALKVEQTKIDEYQAEIKRLKKN